MPNRRFFSHGTETYHMKPQLCVGFMRFCLWEIGAFTCFRPQHLANTRRVVFVGRGVLFLLVSMAPHLTKFELDFIF